MNDQQRQVIASRQRKLVAEQMQQAAPERAATPATPPPEPFEDVIDREQARVRGLTDGGERGRPVVYLRFIDKTFQLPGMQSGEQLVAVKKPNGQEHAIELVQVAGAGCFLVWYLDAPRREIKHEFVERSAVKTWRLA